MPTFEQVNNNNYRIENGIVIDNSSNHVVQQPLYHHPMAKELNELEKQK